MRTTILALALALAACSNSSSSSSPEKAAAPPTSVPAPAPRPPPPQAPALQLPTQTTDVPINAWVRTTGYDGKAFLGFTYMDSVKGPCIKGEFTDGLSDGELSKRLQDFPSDSFEPFPAGHPATPLTADEIKKLKLPNPPAWVADFH